MGRAAKAYSSSGTWATYPNKEAVEWIVLRLAPALLNLNSSATIDIIGGTHEQISSDACPANVRYHGVASYDEAVQKFTDCGLFIAPIKNNLRKSKSNYLTASRMERLSRPQKQL